jgi:hypothetical protein
VTLATLIVAALGVLSTVAFGILQVADRRRRGRADVRVVGHELYEALGGWCVRVAISNQHGRGIAYRLHAWLAPAGTGPPPTPPDLAPLHAGEDRAVTLHLQPRPRRGDPTGITITADGPDGTKTIARADGPLRVADAPPAHLWLAWHDADGPHTVDTGIALTPPHPLSWNIPGLDRKDADDLWSIGGGRS